eukprot:3934315-Rhodomonas_salina.1
MTRHAGEALTEQQRRLCETCEQVLGSRRWNDANVRQHSGSCDRLTAVIENSLPAMRVLSQKKLAELGRIPRSHEGHQEDALQAVERCGRDFDGAPNAVLIFFSHRWLRPNWCEAMGRDLAWGTPEREEAQKKKYAVGDPDDAEHSKAKALIAFGAWFQRRKRSTNIGDFMATTFGQLTGTPEIFWWIDWACTDQDNPGPDMAALPAYAGACAMMLAGWTPEYAQRGWCQVELLMGYAFMQYGHTPMVLPEKFEDHDQNAWEESAVVLADPCEGQLSNPSDKAVIESLRDVAHRSSAFSWWR